MKIAYVTRAAGFLGSILTEVLVQRGYVVCAILRPGAKHNNRVQSLENIYTVECQISDYGDLANRIKAMENFRCVDGSFFFICQMRC